MATRRDERLQKLADMSDTFESAFRHLKDYGTDLFKAFTSEDKPDTNQPSTYATKPTGQFNVAEAVSYNTKNEPYFQKYEADIKRVLGTSSDWKSEDFAKSVYNWQEKNGLTGKWLDGKFGPITMDKLSKQDPVLAKSYDAYEALKTKHLNDKPYSRVMNLTAEVDRIRREMGATDIPLSMLMGWIQVESGGRINDLTTSAGFREAGLFQISEEEAKSIGADQDRILKDQDYAIRTGIELVRHHAAKLDQILAQNPKVQPYFSKTANPDLYWRLVMFGFSAGDGTLSKLVTNMANSGQEFKSWDDVMRYASYNPYGYKHSPIKWTYHINRAFNLGDQMVPQQQQQQQMVANIRAKQRIKNAKREARMLVLQRVINK